MKKLCLVMSLIVSASASHAADTATATTAINTLGIELLAKTPADSNSLLSPYSIQDALAMTYTGADGDTKAQMMKALHFPEDTAALGASFSELQKQLVSIQKSSADVAAASKKHQDPITISVANRLFGQQGFAFREPFLHALLETYDAPLEPLDFGDSQKSTKTINTWVADQTHDRIRDIIPAGVLNKATRLVLVNAIYLKAAWAKEFQKAATIPAPFHVSGGSAVHVPTMQGSRECGCDKKDGFTAVTLSYLGGELQFLILLPDDPAGLPALESKLTPALLADCAKMGNKPVMLWLPKFKMEPPAVDLGSSLKSLGMESAFDEPHGSANFDLMAPRTPDSYLCISKVLHKTFLSLDENGTEAAAATAVVMMLSMAMPAKPEKPIEIHVDHPFLFAIQHRESGACLFIGRVVDPR
jgi:serpin B